MAFEKIFLEWIHTHALYVMFVLGFLSFPELMKILEKLIYLIRGGTPPVKEEPKKEGE